LAIAVRSVGAGGSFWSSPRQVAMKAGLVVVGTFLISTYSLLMLRGKGGQDIYFDSSGHSRFLHILQKGLERYHHRVHAFCLTNNCVHLALQVVDISLSQRILNLAFRTIQYINRKPKKPVASLKVSSRPC